MKGPFFAERDIVLSSDFPVAVLDTTDLLRARPGVSFLLLISTAALPYLVRRLTIKTSVRLLLRVL